MTTSRWWLRGAAALVVLVAAVVFAGPTIADAFAPTSGAADVEITGCGHIYATFYGKAWVNDTEPVTRLHARRIRGDIHLDGDRATLTFRDLHGDMVRRSMRRSDGFRVAVGCI